MVAVFDGRSFLNMAESLRSLAPSAGTPESAYRSCINRAYYACFHVFRAKYFETKVWYSIDRSGRAHWVTHLALRNKVRTEEGGSVASEFDTLWELREHADYHGWLPVKRGTRPAPPFCYCPWGRDPKANCDLAMDIANRLLRDKGPAT